MKKLLRASHTKIEKYLYPTRIVMRLDNENKVTPYSTHMEMYIGKDEYSYSSGDYLRTIEEANESFERRMKLHKVEEDLELGAMLVQ